MRSLTFRTTPRLSLSERILADQMLLMATGIEKMSISTVDNVITPDRVTEDGRTNLHYWFMWRVIRSVTMVVGSIRMAVSMLSSVAMLAAARGFIVHRGESSYAGAGAEPAATACGLMARAVVRIASVLLTSVMMAASM